jgi:hypothetical protein
MWLLLTGLNSVAEATSTLTLEHPVHFTASDGSDIIVDAGSYTADTLVGSRIRLNAQGGATFFLDAQATTHSEELEAPLAIVMPGDDPDVVHVALLLPNGQALDALGSLSGVRPRGVNAAVLSAANFQAVLTMQLHVLPPAFSVVSYGGKCLDFGPPPQVSGAPVFIYTCNGTIAQQVVVQEINDRHEVILRAGTKVIGVKGSAASPPVLSRGVDPIVRDHRGKAPLSPPPPAPALPDKGAILQDHRSKAPLPAPPLVMVMPVAPPGFAGELLLELQDEPNRQGGRMETTAISGSASASGQVFALDGDSIILVSDRTKVVKVQGNRGRDRTPLVLGRRDLADAEFWTFVATDKSNRKPTSGFVRVPQEKDLARAVNEARWGTVIEVDPGVSIALNPPLPLYVPEGVTIRGDRRGIRFGPELSAPKGFDGTMLDIRFSDVRVTGLRLRGPSRSTVDEASNKDARAIHVLDSANRVLIDHNDISDWPAQGVRVSGADEPAVCNDHRDPRGYRPNNVRVARNFIHHNQKQNRGYGVQAHINSFPLIDGNTFYSNRHAIEASGTGCTNYLAWNNLVLSTAPLQDRVGPFNDYTHDFDVHGTERLKLNVIVDIDLTGGFGGNAGQYFEISRNTFLGTNRQNFDLRGEPSYLVEMHHNVSLRSLGDAIGCSYCGGGISKLKVSDTNQFSVLPNPTTRLGVGDIDGDGRDDLFLATGAAWYYAPAGNAEWRFLNAQADGIAGLLFGDFDADGRTDVFTQRGREWLVSWGAASPWEKINESNPALSEFRVGDFIGDKRADVFYSDGQRWWVSDGGVGSFTNTQDSGFRAKDLGFGDFNGDGKTDVVGVVSGKWMVSLSATGSWADFPLRAALTTTMTGLIIADFNGNGRADIAQAYGKSVSYDGRGNWTGLPSRPGTFAAVGRFDAKPGVDIVFYWTNDNHLGIQSSGNGAAVRHSRQHMR